MRRVISWTSYTAFGASVSSAVKGGGSGGRGIVNPSQMLSGACCGLNSESVLAIGIVNGCGNYSYSLLLFV